MNKLRKITFDLYVDLDNINWLVLDKEKNIGRFTYSSNNSCYECSYDDAVKIRKLIVNKLNDNNDKGY